MPHIDRDHSPLSVDIVLLSSEHVRAVTDLGADESLSWTSSVPFPLTRKDVELWQAQTHTASPMALTFIILSDRTVVGCVSLKKIDRAGGSAELSYWIGNAYRGQGFAGDAATLAVAHAFDILNLDYVHPHALLHGNAGSICILSKLGFVQDMSRADLPGVDRFAARFPGDVWRLFRLDTVASAPPLTAPALVAPIE